MIPTRFQTTCHFCECELDTRRAGVHQFVEGWVPNRKGGGANTIRLAQHHYRYACKLCIDIQAKHQPMFQMTLFNDAPVR